MGKVVFAEWPPEVSEEFNAESPRALVILSSAMLEQTLKGLLQTYLVASPTRDDSLFDGPNAPLGSFSSRIDLSYRLGLISHKMCRDLHVIRKIRNDFAHDITGCTFENQAVKNRVFELKKSFPIFKNPKFKSRVKTDKEAFQFVSSIIQVCLHYLANEISPMSQKSVEGIYEISKIEKETSHSKKQK